MNILLYIALFLIGVIVGNFWQRAIYRIPRNISLTKKGVTCIEPESKSKCSKKLLQIFYLLLGGISFIIFAKFLEININSLKVSAIIMYLFTVSYLTMLVIIAGIDNKYVNIEKKVITSGIIVSIMYIVFLYIIDPLSIYFNTMCLASYMILLIIDTVFLRRYAKNSYTVGILMLFNIILIFSEVDIFAYTMSMTAIEILSYLLVLKINQKKNGNKKIKIDKIPVGYFVSASNIIVLLVSAILQSI